MIITIANDFDLDKIADCGQCFRSKIIEDDIFRFVHKDHILYISKISESKYSASCAKPEWQNIWRKYFDLKRNYESIRKKYSKSNNFIKQSIEFGKGIRILRQDPWEMLITFIISQRKSIPAIKTSIEHICKMFGTEVATKYETLYLFPAAKTLDNASYAQLNACGLGYRTPYIKDAARVINSGEIDLNALYDADTDELLSTLQTIKGVGKKVANCIALFGYARTNCAPIDVWISRAINTEFDGKSPFTHFGDDAGIIQQYIFYFQKNR